MKIIPKKPTIDLERKLEEKLNKLKLRTELSIVELLREKKTKGNTEEMNLKETNDFDSKMMVEEPQENLKYLEEEPLVLESQRYETVDWFDDFTTAPEQNLQNLIKGIQSRENIDLDEISEDEF